jgi:hypothetical protein
MYTIVGVLQSDVCGSLSSSKLPSIAAILNEN